MTTFDDREQAFEARFAKDQDTEFKAVARANRLLGLWGGALMGLEMTHLEDYALAVVKSDVDRHSEDGVVRKVFEDLKGAGVSASEADVRMKMDELMAVAREQIRTGA